MSQYSVPHGDAPKGIQEEQEEMGAKESSPKALLQREQLSNQV